MPRKSTAKATGVWEKERGSGVWWIRYRAEANSSVRRSGAKATPSTCTINGRRMSGLGSSCPQTCESRGVKFEEIAKDAEEWYVSHGKKDLRTVKNRMKRLVKDFGTQVADTISPAQIDQWLSKPEWTPATCNRYKALFSKTFKIALAAGKVSMNPARLVEQRTRVRGAFVIC